MEQNRASNAPNRTEPARLLALSDGLFATVLTLLVLDLKIPEALSGQGLSPGDFLRSIGPHLFAYLLTFFVAGTYWLAHHRDFDLIVDYDRSLLGYNLLFLLFVGLFPFSTAAVSSFSLSATRYSFYWAIYGANIFLAGIMLTITWLYAVSHGQVAAETTRVQIMHNIGRHLTVPAALLVSVLAQYLFPHIFLGPSVLILIPVLRWGVDRYYARTDPDQPSSRWARGERWWRAGTTLIWVAIILLAAWAAAQ